MFLSEIKIDLKIMLHICNSALSKFCCLLKSNKKPLLLALFRIKLSQELCLAGSSISLREKGALKTAVDIQKFI